MMSLLDDETRNKIASCLRAFYAARYAREDNVPCQIEEGLFLGSVGAAYNKDALKALNVTHILIVAKSLEPAYPNDFIYKKIEVLDSHDVNLEQHFVECIEFIDEAKRMGGGVLVHCFAGRSRSVTVVVAYLMKKHNMSLSQALTLVRSKRPHVAPNHGFFEQLTNFGESLQGTCDLGAATYTLVVVLAAGEIANKGDAVAICFKEVYPAAISVLTQPAARELSHL